MEPQQTPSTNPAPSVVTPSTTSPSVQPTTQEAVAPSSNPAPVYPTPKPFTAETSTFTAEPVISEMKSSSLDRFSFGAALLAFATGIGFMFGGPHIAIKLSFVGILALAAVILGIRSFKNDGGMNTSGLLGVILGMIVLTYVVATGSIYTYTWIRVEQLKNKYNQQRVQPAGTDNTLNLFR